VVVATGILALVGLGISTYLTITHFQPHLLACSSRGFVNCGVVTTSAQSRILGIPVAFLGVAQYLAMVGLCSPWAWRARNGLVHLARLVLAVVGMCFVLWLIIAEFLIIKNLCEWCTGVHIVTFAMFICIVLTVPNMLGWGDVE
jgi:uncharacterized membrane protein